MPGGITKAVRMPVLRPCRTLGALIPRGGPVNDPALGALFFRRARPGPGPHSRCDEITKDVDSFSAALERGGSN